MLAKDIMTKGILYVKEDTPVMQAVDILLENHISGLPVVDNDMRLRGIVSEKDFLGILLEKNVDVNAPVGKFMSKQVMKFREDDNIIDICSFFLKNNVRRVPIVRDDKLIGVISRRDILKAIFVTVLNPGE